MTRPFISADDMTYDERAGALSDMEVVVRQKPCPVNILYNIN